MQKRVEFFKNFKVVLRILFLVFFLGGMSSTSAQSNLDTLFQNANEHHRQGNYQKALDNYQKILARGFVSSELHYNIANTHFAMKAIAPSVYHYKKALQLDPENKDAQHNLSFVQKAILDDIKKVPPTFLQQLKGKYIDAYHYDTWALIAICFLFASLISFAVFYFSAKERIRRLFFGLLVLFALFFVGAMMGAVSQYNHLKNNQEAVVFEKEIQVRQAPYSGSEVLFSLHEGTCVFVLEKVAAYYKVRIADGNIGWVLQNELKKL